MTVKPDLGPSGTLNQRIRADLEARILSGELGPGDRIPFEHELVAQYGCSRMTVNKVLSSLVEAGLIERRRRAGSFVRRPVALSAVLTIADIKAEITERGEAYDYQLLSRDERAATAADRARLGVARGDRVIAVRCRHVAGARPFAVEDRLLNLSAVPEVAVADLSVEPPGRWLLAHVPWTEAEHRIAAVSADAATAEALGIPVGAACLVVRRKTFRGGQTITAVALTYPGDQHELVARFTP
ncbi:MAG TPA: histidine utilization repressor [Methylomirabilota bacterium]|nr:histidine utilization repressor [Methylomirabilota bacterium]